VQDTGLAQVQLEEEGLETVTRVDRPAMVGENLVLRCAFTDARGGQYRLEEAQLPADKAQYAGEAAEGADEDTTETGHESEDRVAVML